MATQQKSTWRWLAPALVAVITFIGGVASNLVAAELESLLPSYRWVIWGVFGVAFIVAVVSAVQYAKEKEPAPEEPTAHNERSVNIGGGLNQSTIVTGDNNQVIHGS